MSGSVQPNKISNGDVIAPRFGARHRRSDWIGNRPSRVDVDMEIDHGEDSTLRLAILHTGSHRDGRAGAKTHSIEVQPDSRPELAGRNQYGGNSKLQDIF